MVHVTDSHEDPDQKSGQRHRFHAAGSPSSTPARRPVPSSSPAAVSTGGTPAAGEADGHDGRPSDAEVVKTTGTMAVATLLSRITGFLRTVLIGSALGPAIASAFNTANTLPNLITELVLGAVLTSLVIPLLVRAEKEDPDRGEAFVRRLFTLTFTLMITVTVVAVFAAPLLTRMSLDSDGKVNVGMSTAFAYLVLPQIVFYAMFAVMMAVLNTKGYFKPGAWAPVVNNVVTLGVLGLYWLLPRDSKLSPNDSVTITDPHIMLLGLGTTAGVVAQTLIMVPY
ncbi:murein biosynthesis integral membrane protein MurJ, partial [uncultured Corynebacterium sp.]|uniref:murein biosynthesis integral membrane protein MurJ n=1 Tax=uncultured Corynebacterium sp. TaxID=159447 RepID=UPI0025F63D9B